MSKASNTNMQQTTDACNVTTRVCMHAYMHGQALDTMLHSRDAIFGALVVAFTDVKLHTSTVTLY
jgi:hypothetical protein